MSEAPFDARAEARRLMRTARWASLATLRTGKSPAFPYCSLVTVATDIDNAPLVLISRLALHTANLEVAPEASLLFAEVGGGDPFEHPRVSVAGRFVRVADKRVRRRFLARHPDAALYAGFADFAFWRLEVVDAHLVAGFGRIVDLSGADLLVDLASSSALVEAEEEAIAHVNSDHAETISLYATKLLGRPPGDWRMTGLDPEGCDLACGDDTARLLFPERVDGPAALRKAFQSLAARARGEA